MTIQSTPSTLEYMRQTARSLLNEFDAADGLASNYILHHDDRRSAIFLHRDAHDNLAGVLARCTTGIDLFRQLVTLRTRGGGAVESLFKEALLPGRPYMLIMPENLLDRVQQVITLRDRVHSRIMRMDPARYRAEVSAMIVHTRDHQGNPRTEIRVNKNPVAVAGVNWRSPIFADIYVDVRQEQRGRGWGRSLVNALVEDLLKERVTPLYTVADGNDESLALAQYVGFVDTGAREIVADALRET